MRIFENFDEKNLEHKNKEKFVVSIAKKVKEICKRDKKNFKSKEEDIKELREKINIKIKKIDDLLINSEIAKKDLKFKTESIFNENKVLKSLISEKLRIEL